MPTRVNPAETTAEQLFAMPADGYRYELVAGELRMMSPAGGRHGRIAIQVAHLLKQHVDGRELGVVYAAETGFLIERAPDTVLAPDVAFVSTDRHATIDDEISYLPVTPDLAVEVLSPSDRFSRVEAKAFQWLDAGTKLVLLVDPETQTIHRYQSRKQIEVYETSEAIDCSSAVKAWTLNVQDVFK
jgi:Uma2 family endonuclease